MEIKGIIDTWGCPILQCDVGNPHTLQKATFKAVIDTGAFHFHLKQWYIDALNLPVISPAEALHPKEGKQDTFNYSGILHFEFGHCSIVIQPILDSYEYDFIIGTQFLLGKTFNYDNPASAWKIHWEA